MPLRIRRIQSASGSSIALGPLNVLVGPNNSGKSQTLRDIREYVTTGASERMVVAQNLELELPTEKEALEQVRRLPHSSPGHSRIFGVSFDLQQRHELVLGDDWLSQQYGSNNEGELLRHMGRFWVAHLDAESRLRLANPTDAFDLRNENPSNAMQAFFHGGEEAQKELRQAFSDAFNMDIVLDWAAMRRWYLRVGRSFGEVPRERELLDDLVRDARELAEQGDGYRSFAGVVLAMLTFENRLLLLDEPEAFLHPAQARVLGRWLGRRAADGKVQVLLATHDSAFLWGLVSGNPNVQVIRLNRQGDDTRYHSVPAATTSALIQSPFLSSQPVLDALFQEGVAVCEGDPDRAVYQTVAHHVLDDEQSEGSLFIHSNGKDSLKVPVALLREAGTPVCGVADFDIFNSEAVLKELIEALTGMAVDPDILKLRGQLSEAVERKGDDELLGELREGVEEWLAETPGDLREARRKLHRVVSSASKWGDVKKNGMSALGLEDRRIAEQLLERCKAAGVFVVPKGALESWLDLSAKKGKRWNRKALETLHAGECPPDLKGFVGEIVRYLATGGNNGNQGGMVE